MRFRTSNWSIVVRRWKPSGSFGLFRLTRGPLMEYLTFSALPPTDAARVFEAAARRLTGRTAP